MNDCDKRVKILFSMLLYFKETSSLDEKIKSIYIEELVYELEKELRRIKKYIQPIQPTKYERYYELLERYKKGAEGSGRSKKG